VLTAVAPSQRRQVQHGWAWPCLSSSVHPKRWPSPRCTPPGVRTGGDTRGRLRGSSEQFGLTTMASMPGCRNRSTAAIEGSQWQPSDVEMIRAIAAETGPNHLHRSQLQQAGEAGNFLQARTRNRSHLQGTMQDPAVRRLRSSGATSPWSTTALRASCGAPGKRSNSRSRCQTMSGCWAKEPRQLARLREKPNWATHVKAEDRHPQGAQVPGGPSTVPSPRAER